MMFHRNRLRVFLLVSVLFGIVAVTSPAAHATTISFPANMSDAAKVLVRDYNMNAYGGITRWTSYPIRIWADPTHFASSDLQKAIDLWGSAMGSTGISFAIADTPQSANITFGVGSLPPGAPPGACGVEGPTQITNHVITAGAGTYRNAPTCIASGAAAPTALAHGIGHILGLAGHTPDNTDVMSAPTVPFIMSDTLRQAMTFIYSTPPGTLVDTVTFTLTVMKAGSGIGTVTAGPAGIDCGNTCTASYVNDTTVTLTATPTSGSTFASWNSNCPNGVVTMDADKTCTATFTVAQQPLTVTPTGAGSGIVTSSPAGISCPLTCSAPFAQGQSVTLSATAASGSTFQGWSGEGCSGTGACTVTLNAATSVSATFLTDIGSPLVAAVLPISRSVQVGTPATAFATIINGGSAMAFGCSISLLTSIPVTFAYQATDPATNQVTGTPNTPIDILAGAAESFVFAFTPTAPINSTDVQFGFDCANTNPAPIFSGLNTLLFSASATPVPDIVALAATLNKDGLVNIPGTTGTGVFAVATVNVSASATITASADTGAATVAASVSMCETNPATGQCISAIGSSVTTQINANATPTFGIFVTGNGNVPFDPATNRIFVRFKDSGGVTRGATSVAVRTQ